MTLPGGSFCNFCCCAAVFGVIALNPEATSRFSLFWVLVCVVEQPINKAVHAVAILQINVRLDGFIGRNLVVDSELPNQCLESDSGRDLRAVHDDVENEMIVLEIGGEGAITDFGKDVPSKVDAQNALDLPH